MGSDGNNGNNGMLLMIVIMEVICNECMNDRKSVKSQMLTQAPPRYRRTLRLYLRIPIDTMDHE